MTDTEKNKYMDLSLDEKLEAAKDILKEALSKYGENIGLGWTGGKDSTLVLWLTRQACEEMGRALPRCLFIDDGDTFPEIFEIVDDLKEKWDVPLIVLKNQDVLNQAAAIGDSVVFEKLNQANQKALEEMGFGEDELPFEPESLEGNHLMKTVPLREAILQHGLAAFIVGLRWDEQEARSQEEFISPRENPQHDRVHPILFFSERDIWDAHLKLNLPFCSLYREGYRSLGSRYNTQPVEEGVPPWEQDLENTTERLGRGMHKEQMMSRLRSLGYM